MNIKTNTTTAAGIVLYTLYSEHAELELCFSTYSDGSPREVMSGKFEFCSTSLTSSQTFENDTISSVIHAIQDMVVNRYIYLTSDYESEYNELIEYAECFEFIAHASKQLRVFQGVIEA